MGRTREQKHMLMLYLLMAMCFLMWIALLSLTVVNGPEDDWGIKEDKRCPFPEDKPRWKRLVSSVFKEVKEAQVQRGKALAKQKAEEAGYKPTGCACGMGCSSWDFRTDSTCHCQCAGIDWTAARCCKIGLE
ncbi:unnamed protein product [Natator depressus]